MPDPFPPSERVELVARAILLRAGIARFQEERRANWDRLALRPGDATARLQNADDLQTLDDALRLMDRAIDLLESPTEDRVAVVAFGIEQLQHRVTELEEYADLKEPIGLLRELIES
ncbi:hypothetical protein GCM10009853_065800 [Glycomyces scopariae]|uniref:Uncharacterized protein n=1 Tax=Glycomyces sambucus TaxID=380244 RepID=A0A1G9H6D4_9ACTN|nr:hypothetical protein [Glycomyces sambucus]SDL08517.1 hypothetical protein SAMN05216298_2652 [Glycomyces sambucus]